MNIPLEELPAREAVAWVETAACRNHGKTFFPPDGLNGSDYARAAREAKEICATCPHTGLNGRCYEAWASQPFESLAYGIWAGHSGKALKAMRYSNQKAEDIVAEGEPRGPIRRQVFAAICQGHTTGDTIAGVTGLGSQQISDALRGLDSQGLIRRVSTGGGQGVYTVWEVAQ